ncbi:MAG: YIP1 family protein [Pseudomonadota bacterium]
MPNKTFSEINIQDQMAVSLNTAIAVITNPIGFFKTMPKTGGLVEPLIFLALIGGVGGILQAILSIFGVGLAASFFMALAYIVIVPIVTALFGFVSAAILFVIWKLMGSLEPFETAFRCGAYAAAITPLTTLLGIIPYLGPLLGLGWMTYLLVMVSVEVYKIEAKKAWMVFGIIAGLLAISSISSQIAAQRITSQLDQLQETMKQAEKMTPEEAGQKMGEFLKGLEKGAGKQK